ncbi:ClbS/DfsB family four-helix bundle protein [Asaia siamensis]|nr:ClbS/DfsB family four-helix bundle protein [Asaia siamensis]
MDSKALVGSLRKEEARQGRRVISVPVSKAELLSALCMNFDKLMIDLSRVPQRSARDRTLAGHAAGTVMSPADLVSYLLGWNQLVLKWLDRDDRGLGVDFPEAGFKWNQLGLLAQKFYVDYADLSYPELLERLSIAKQHLVATISARTDAELYSRPWYDKWSKGRMIQFNTASPYANARGRIRKWLKDNQNASSGVMGVSRNESDVA